MTKYLIDNEEVTLKEFYERLEEENRYECEDSFDDILDDSEDEIKVCGFTFAPSTILKNCDEVAYRCALNDFESNQLDDIQYQLEQCDEVVGVNGYRFEIKEIEEEESEDEED